MKFLRSLSETLTAISILIAIKVEQLLRQSTNIISPIFDTLHKLSIAFVISLALFAVILQGPTLHQKFIRKYVGSSVYYVSATVMGGGGTAFSVVAPSGKVYYLTNDHICVDSETGTVVIKDEFLFLSERKIVARSQTTDLCLIEAPDWEIGLRLAKKVSLGERVQAVGHPALLPLTLSNIGEIIANRPTTLIDKMDEADKAQNEVIPLLIPSKCDTNNPKFFIFKNKKGVSQCYIDIPDAFFTNVLIKPGNSGSPLVNFNGEVVGVVSGVDKYGWATAVSLNDVVNFLSDR